MSMICLCVPNVCQLLDETVLNHKHNTKVMSRSHQGLLKGKLAGIVKMSTFFINSHTVVVESFITKDWF